MDSMSDKYKKAVRQLKVIEEAGKRPKIPGIKMQTVGGKSHPGRKYSTEALKDDDEVVEEKGIFDTMVDELPPQPDDKEETTNHRRVDHHKIKLYRKRQKKEKAAKQARKKQRKK